MPFKNLSRVCWNQYSCLRLGKRTKECQRLSNEYAKSVLPGTGAHTLSSWAGGVGSIPANPDAQNVPSFRRWRFEMKLSPFYLELF
jgi:hypothetical protein